MSRPAPRIPGAPFVPIAIGAVLPIVGISMLANGAWSGYGRAGGLALFLITAGLALLVIGIAMVRPWFRYRGSTTPEERSAHRKAATATRRERRANGRPEGR